MANEEKNQPSAPTPIDPQNPPEPIKDIEDKTIRELRDVPVESIPDEQLPEIAKEIKEDEPEDVRAARRAAEETLNQPIEAIEDTVNALDVEDHSEVVRGRAAPHRRQHDRLHGADVPGSALHLRLFRARRHHHHRGAALAASARSS